MAAYFLHAASLASGAHLICTRTYKGKTHTSLYLQVNQPHFTGEVLCLGEAFNKKLHLQLNLYETNSSSKALAIFPVLGCASLLPERSHVHVAGKVGKEQNWSWFVEVIIQLCSFIEN